MNSHVAQRPIFVSKPIAVDLFRSVQAHGCVEACVVRERGRSYARVAGELHPVDGDVVHDERGYVRRSPMGMIFVAGEPPRRAAPLTVAALLPGVSWTGVRSAVRPNAMMHVRIDNPGESGAEFGMVAGRLLCATRSLRASVEVTGEPTCPRCLMVARRVRAAYETTAEQLA